MKVSELIGADLDYWTGRADGIPDSELAIVRHQRGDEMLCVRKIARYAPSTVWSMGGPIIERNQIGLGFPVSDLWQGFTSSDGFGSPFKVQYGQTPLIAAMRVFVAIKYGDEVTG